MDKMNFFNPDFPYFSEACYGLDWDFGNILGKEYLDKMEDILDEYNYKFSDSYKVTKDHAGLNFMYNMENLLRLKNSGFKARECFQPNSYMYYYYCSNNETPKEYVSLISTQLRDKYLIKTHIILTSLDHYPDEEFMEENDYIPLSGLNEYLHITHHGKNTKVYQLKGSNCVLILTDNAMTLELHTEIKKVHYSLYEEDFPLPEYEQLLDALRSGDNETISNIFEDLNKEKFFINRAMENLRKILKYDNSSDIAYIQASNMRFSEEIKRCENTICKNLELIRANEQTIINLRNDANNDEMLEYLLDYCFKSPYITNIEQNPDETSCLCLSITAPLLYYNLDHLANIIDSYEGLDRDILELFRSEEYHLMTRCKIIFSKKYFTVDTIKIGNSDKVIRHPHIDTYGCFGTHDTGIRNSAEARDYLGAFEQIVQAALNLNFLDATVLNTMLENIRDNPSIPTWEDNEGNRYTAVEVLERKESN